jgi:hypothetical protein
MEPLPIRARTSGKFCAGQLQKNDVPPRQPVGMLAVETESELNRVWGEIGILDGTRREDENGWPMR